MKNRETKFRFEQMENSNIHKLYIYDDVTAYGDFNWETWDYDESETSANYFREQLSEIPDTGEIELHVNSCGGSVMEGLAIYNLLKQHMAHKTCYIDGFAYSIASVICLACDKIIMGLGTSMLVHNMSMSVYGNANELRKAADDLDVLMESNRKIYMDRAKNLTEEELEEMMDKETFLTPEQCLEYGFCDEIGTYQVDQNRMNQQAITQVMQLRQQIGNFQTLREEMKEFTKKIKEKEEPYPMEQELNDGNRKVLKMVSAFLNAFQKEEENEK
ncbi:MAG: Clp protease ClpP [Candidatus Choladocola sp.]|nr:Clp protease ClpP [Candidatus Choladocola sp.]